jgi:transcriptional regulator with XRE-family HTH domain
MKTLGERLKIAREYAGLSQEKLGEEAGCGQAVVSKIERGDQKKSAYVVQLAVACNVRPEWLAMEEGEMKEEVRYSTDPLVKRVVSAMLHLKEEEQRYIVIMAEAITRKDLAENAVDEPQPGVIGPNIPIDGGLGHEPDSSDQIEQPHKRKRI